MGRWGKVTKMFLTFATTKTRSHCSILPPRFLEVLQWNKQDANDKRTNVNGIENATRTKLTSTFKSCFKVERTVLLFVSCWHQVEKSKGGNKSNFEICHFPSEEAKKTKVLLCFAERSRVSAGEPWTPQELQVCVWVCVVFRVSQSAF